MKRINIPTSGGLIWLSLNTKTDSSYWRSSCAGMLPWSLHLNGSLNVAAPGGIKEPELDITRCCFIPTCCETSEETFRRWGMILWHALPAHWISRKLRSVMGLNKTKTLITVIDALWENKMEQKKKKNKRTETDFFFLGCITAGEPVDLLILLVLQSERWDEVAFIKRQGQAWGFF